MKEKHSDDELTPSPAIPIFARNKTKQKLYY